MFVSAHLKRSLEVSLKRKGISNSRGVVLAEVLKKTDISIERDENFSDRVCNPAQGISAIWAVCILG